MRCARLCIATLILLLIVEIEWTQEPASRAHAGSVRGAQSIGCPRAHHVTFSALPSRADLQGLRVSWPLRVAIPLRVVLEWQTYGIDDFSWWVYALRDAARFLDYATNGQAAIGRIDLYDNACEWASADVQVYARNTQIPDATVGGISAQTVTMFGGKLEIALAPKLVPSVSSGGVFPSTSGTLRVPGSIHLGRSWSETGPVRGRWTEPAGFRTIIHELGHYAFYLYDEYYGYDDSNPSNPRRVAFCTGAGHMASSPANASLMYWEYTRDTFWYWKPGMPLGGCAGTRQWQVYQQPDWSVIHAHYPSLKHIVPSAHAPGPLACAGCNASTVNRWHLSFVRHSPIMANGYLVKRGGARMLLEGVTCPKAPCLPGQSLGQLEAVGGDKGDVIRVTGTDSASGTWQAIQVLNGPRGDVARIPGYLPHWYGGKNSANIPTVDAVPVLRGTDQTLAGLRIVASDPAGALPLVNEDRISASLYEAGLGPNNEPRHPTTVLSRSGATHSGSLSLVSGCSQGSSCPPILDGAVYLTPLVSKRPQQYPDRPDGPRAAWELAALSLSCNDPSDYLVGHAPGDEDGLDSADGVVNVHLTVSSSSLKKFCLAITGQPSGASRSGSRFTESYGIHGALSGFKRLPASLPGTSRPVRAVVTLHYDSTAVQGGSPVVVPSLRSGVPASAAVKRVLLGECTDIGSGTVSVTVPLDALNGQYQFQVISSRGLNVRASACKPANNSKS